MPDGRFFPKQFHIILSYWVFVRNSEHIQCQIQYGRKKSQVANSTSGPRTCFTEIHSDAREDKVFMHLTSTDFPIIGVIALSCFTGMLAYIKNGSYLDIKISHMFLSNSDGRNLRI